MFNRLTAQKSFLSYSEILLPILTLFMCFDLFISVGIAICPLNVPVLFRVLAVHFQTWM